MVFQLLAVPDEENVREAIHLGEGQQIELRESVRSALEIGKLVSGFANATGGWIILGVREPAAIVGVDPILTQRFFNSVNHRTRPPQDLMMHSVVLEGKEVRVIVVKPSQELVITDAGAFIREGERTRPLNAGEIQAKTTPAAAAREPAEFAESLAGLTETVDELMRKFDYAQTWRAQGMNLLVGCAGSSLSTVIFAVLGFVLGFITGWFYPSS